MKRNLTILFVYTVLFSLLLIPVTDFTLKTWCLAIILAFFASLLNDLREKKL